jgi:hypothetical protein
MAQMQLQQEGQLQAKADSGQNAVANQQTDGARNDQMTQEWQSPAASCLITSPFGPRNMSKNKGGGSSNHKGIDLRAYQGTAIVAAADGKATVLGGNYNTLDIVHSPTLKTRYLHASAIKVSNGKNVKKGDTIALSGGKGPQGPNQFNAHLHFEVHQGVTKIDPEAFLINHGVSLSRKQGLPARKDAADPAVATPEKALTPAKETAAIKWYKNKGFTADLIKRIQAVVNTAETGTMDAAAVQAVGEWQKSKDFVGKQVDGEFGGGSAERSGDKQLETDIKALLNPKKVVADIGKAAQNDDSASANNDAQNALSGGGARSDTPELTGTTATPVFDDVPEGPVMTEKNEYGLPLSKYHVGMSNGSANREEWRLHPTLRTKLAKLRELLANENLGFFVSEGMRSPGRQQYLYEQGRTRKGKIVTNAKAWKSNHNYGCAIDFAPKNGDWNGANWTRLGELAESVGLEWGGRWTNPVDRPHVQLKKLPGPSKCKEIYTKSGIEGIWSMF